MRVALAAALLLAPSVARAHIGFRSSDPANGSSLTAAPGRITLRFTGRPQLGFSRVRLIGPQGEVARGIPTTDAADRARRLGLYAIALYLIAAGYRLYAESTVVHGAENALNPALMSRMVTGTTWGIGWLIGVLGATALLAGWLISRRTAAGMPFTCWRRARGRADCWGRSLRASPP